MSSIVQDIAHSRHRERNLLIAPIGVVERKLPFRSPKWQMEMRSHFITPVGFRQEGALCLIAEGLVESASLVSARYLCIDIGSRPAILHGKFRRELREMQFTYPILVPLAQRLASGNRKSLILIVIGGLFEIVAQSSCQ